MKGLVAAAKKVRGGDESATDESTGPVGRVKSALAKATQAVAGIVKKDDGGGEGAAGAVADGEPTQNARKMKDAVEAARKAREDD
jgi:hypothetical protein